MEQMQPNMDSSMQPGNAGGNNTMGIISLVLGILSIVFSFLYVYVGLILGIVGIVPGVKGTQAGALQYCHSRLCVQHCRHCAECRSAGVCAVRSGLPLPALAPRPQTCKLSIFKKAAEHRFVAFLFVYRKPLARRVVQKRRLMSIMEKKNSLCYTGSAVWQLHKQAKGGHSKMNDVNSLSHTSWNCKISCGVRTKIQEESVLREKRREIGSILRTLCNWEGIKIIEAEVCPDHIHMLIEIPPKIAVASFMGYLKGKSSLMLYEKFPKLKYKYRNREFWCRGYYVDTAGGKMQRRYRSTSNDNTSRTKQESN